MTHSSKGSIQGGNHSHRIFGNGQNQPKKMLSNNQRAGSKISQPESGNKSIKSNTRYSNYNNNGSFVSQNSLLGQRNLSGSLH
jgi:hypothetical protein